MHDVDPKRVFIKIYSPQSSVPNERSEWAVNTNLHTSIAKLGPSALLKV